MTSRNYYQALLLAAAALLSGCSAYDDTESSGSASVGGKGQAWQATANAVLQDVAGDEEESSTRAVFYGGNSRRYYTLWDKGDQVTVYQGNTSVGTMTPTSYGTLVATLTGTLNGSFTAGESLGVYLPSKALNYVGQNGTIYGMSSGYSFQQATVTVENTANQILTLSDVNPSHRQSYVRFILQDADTGNRLHFETLQLFAASGKLVKTRSEDGETTTYFTDDDPLTVTSVMETGEYPPELFVAILNDNGTADTYHLKGTIGSDVYVGPVDKKMGAISAIGALNMLNRTLRKTTAASTLTIEDIAVHTFTGSAIEPTLTVKDGESPLTLDSDYSVSYSSNVNVGTATATIRGKAMDGDVCATPYLGTKDKTFTISKATPVIEMDASDMTLEMGTKRTRAVTGVSIDNSAYSIDNLNIMPGSSPYACTITYSSNNPAVATVDASTGEVTGVAIGTAIITATIPATGNWVERTQSYIVKVSSRVNASGTSPWTVNEDEEIIRLHQ